MGNVPTTKGTGRQDAEPLPRITTDALAEADWSEDERQAFDRLLLHWRVGEGELEEVYVPTWAKFEGQVTVVRWRGDLLVLKCLRPPSALYQELGVWFRLRPHSRVVGFRGVVPGRAAVLTDFMPLGSLEAFVLSSSAPPAGSPAWLRQGVSLLLDVAHGMAHLHAEGFVWRDCAARNVLLCKEDGDDRLLRAKITDFGFSRRMDADGRHVVPKQTFNLPVRIAAPESLASDDAEYSVKSDVWSFGVLLFSLFARKRPYGDLATDKVVEGVTLGTLLLSADDLQLVPSDDEASGASSKEKETKEKKNEKKNEKKRRKGKKAARKLRRLFEACMERESRSRPTTADIIRILTALSPPPPSSSPSPSSIQSSSTYE